MLKSMSFALPLYGLCNVAGDEKSVFRRSVSGKRQWKGKLVPAGLHGKALSQRRGCLLKRLCCAVQPLQQVQYNSRKIAPGLEGATLQSNGVLGKTEWRALPDIWRTAAEKFGDRVALIDPHHHPFTTMSFSQLRQAILEFAEGLRVTGILPNEKIALFADNSCRWLVADQGIMAAGAIDAVRGTQSAIKELIHIYTHSDSVALVVDNHDLLGKLGPELQDSTSLKFVVLLWGEKPQPTEGPEGFKFVVYTYDEVIAKGRDRLNFLASMGHPVSTQCDYIEPEDIATLVYTSGTTGNPKGVMLTHANLLHQVLHLGKVVDINPGDRFVSLLPPWHMYERSCEYFSLTQGIEQVYTNVKSLKEDLKKYSPDYLVSVPLVFDILYSGVQKQLSSGSSARKFIAFTLIRISMMYKEWIRTYEGKVLARAKVKTLAIVAACEWIFARIMAAILLPLHKLARFLIYRKIHAAVGIKKVAMSGGGSLAPQVDRFFEAIDITILNGYGLTESSPVVSARVPKNNVLGTVGRPLHETEIKVVNPESGENLPQGTRGLVKVRGPQVMKGYYKNPAATATAVDGNGWLDTGDLGWIVPDIRVGPARSCSGTLVLDGRVKDTIVLSTGENIDPTQIEEVAMQSRYIQQIMVVGQDQRRLGALVVPNVEELQEASITLAETDSLIRRELNKYTSSSLPIGPFLLIFDPFTLESGLLTPTMKMRRNVIAEKYSSQIEDLFRRLH